MLDGAVAKRYADALFSIASEKNVIDQVETDLALITGILKQHPELKRVLNHPSISAEVKKKQMEELFSSSVQEVVIHFVYLLLDRRRGNLLDEIHYAFVRMADEARGRIKAHIETVVPLSQEDLQTVAKQLGALCGKELDINASVNPHLIAGARIRLGDRLIDASVQGKLDRFKNELKHQVR